MINAVKGFLKVILYQPLFNLLVFLVWLMPGHDVGAAIITLTVLIRFALYPSQTSSIKSQKKMQAIQPELEEIKKKYANNQQAQAQATMDLYKRYKVNPFSSCLPLLIQLPILIVLYKVFTVGLNTSRFDLLYSFTPRPEYIDTIFFGINLSHPSIILAIIAGVLQFFQSKMMMPPVPRSDKNKGGTEAFAANFSKQMIYMMPILTVIIAIKLPAALPLYWIITTLFMIIQQKIIYRQKEHIDPKGVSVKVITGNKE